MKLTLLETKDSNSILGFDMSTKVDEPLIQVTIIPKIGEFVKVQDPLLTIETCSSLFSIRSPIEGMLNKLNKDILYMVDKFDFSNWVVSILSLSKEDYDKRNLKKVVKKPKETVSVPDRMPQVLDDIRAEVRSRGLRINRGVISTFYRGTGSTGALLSDDSTQWLTPSTVVRSTPISLFDEFVTSPERATPEYNEAEPE